MPPTIADTQAGPGVTVSSSTYLFTRLPGLTIHSYKEAGQSQLAGSQQQDSFTYSKWEQFSGETTSFQCMYR